MTVPFHWSLRSSRVLATATQAAMWMSWPQECATGVSASRHICLTVLAWGRPVFSGIGKASSSVRTITVGPGPFL